jgi:hypothetical protein
MGISRSFLGEIVKSRKETGVDAAEKKAVVGPKQCVRTYQRWTRRSLRPPRACPELAHARS